MFPATIFDFFSLVSGFLLFFSVPHFLWSEAAVPRSACEKFRNAQFFSCRAERGFEIRDRLLQRDITQHESLQIQTLDFGSEYD